MLATFVVSALAGLAIANPLPAPQTMDFAEIDASSVDLPALGPPVGALNQPLTYDPAAAAAAAAAVIPSDPISETTKIKEKEKRGVNDPCSPQPSGSAPVTTPDTASDFLANSVYDNIAQSAPTPDGYSLSFSDLQGSTQAYSYMGLYTLTSFDPFLCQEHCDSATSCYGFNLYIERDPSIAPADACPDPASLVNYKCTLWGSNIDATTATNTGQWRNQFQVVISGSNGYNKLAAPPVYTNFTGPTEFGGAINAPLSSSGANTYMGAKFYAGPYDPSQCAAACQAQTGYDSRHPASDGTYMPCNFFNSYVLSEDGVPQGTYCSMYSQSWGKPYDNNFGQYRGSDRYTVSQSYGYTLTVQDPGHV
ncbi:hypothetical protein MMC25_003054 [Agyrium rufum]|nr:hypothetical protein [Agyrium rufum]